MQRLYHRLLQRRFLSERHYGHRNLFGRLVRVRFGSALVLSLPALVLTFWYAHVAVGAHLRHQWATRTDTEFTLELFHLHLHDRLVRDWRRLSLPEPTGSSSLPTYGLMLNNDKLDRLESRLPPDEGLEYYVGGLLTRGNKVHRVDVRYRGTRHWNWSQPQKSWKVRMKEKALFDGNATFSFLNTPEAVFFDEQIILDVARGEGLLTPQYYPFRLLLNRAHMGVYLFQSQPDEGLLRNAQRARGSIYSGNEAPIEPKTGVSALWQWPEHWTKVADRDATELGDVRELDALLTAVKRASHQEFADFAARYLNLDRFALFDALDVVFGCNNHDFHQNHKLYFDPDRGRFEPIAWNFRGGKHEPEFNRAENPLLLRLKQLPDYLSRRNRHVYRLLRGPCSHHELRLRAEVLLERLRSDQLRDPFWDATGLLPNLGRYYNELTRPMSRELQTLMSQLQLGMLRRREQFLRDALERRLIRAQLVEGIVRTVQPAGALVDPVSKVPHGAREAESPGLGGVQEQPTAGGTSGVVAVDVSVGGDSGYRVSRIVPSWGGCRPESWNLYADTNLDDQLDLDLATDRVVAEGVMGAAVQPDLELYPAIRMQARRAHAHRGRVQTVTESRRYRLFVTAGDCQASEIRLDVISLATGEAFSVRARKGTDVPQAVGPDCGRPHRSEPGEVSPHPWCYRTEEPQTIELGPGLVEVSRTQVYGLQQAVVIHPGTVFRLATGASLVFQGRLEALGTPTAPIRFEPQEQSWGGLVLRGSGTAGSRLSRVEFERGTQSEWGFIHCPATVCIQDSHDIEIQDSRFRKSQTALRVAAVDGIRLQDIVVQDSTTDALSLTHSSAEIQRLTVLRAGRHCVNAVGSHLWVQDSQFVRCAGDGVLAAKRTSLSVEDSLVTQAKCGLQVVDSSSARLQGALSYKNHVGVCIDASSQRYPGKSRLRGDELHAVGCGKPYEVAGDRPKLVERVGTEIGASDLEPLRVRLLGSQEWNRLDRRIEVWLGGNSP
ncbi:CotH kinase family protein [Myxococcota bacterium]